MGTKAQNKQEKYKKILQMKLNSKVNVLCDKLPKEFIDFVNHIKNLAFDDKPNYQYLKSILGIIYDKYSFNYDTIFDFTDYLTQKEKEEKEKEKEKEKGNSNKTQTDINIFPRLNRNKKEEEKNNEKDHKEKKNINTNNKENKLITSSLNNIVQNYKTKNINFKPSTNSNPTKTTKKIQRFIT